MGAFESMKVEAHASVDAVLDALPWPVILLDEDGEITHGNAALREIAPGDCIGHRFADMFPDYCAALGQGPWTKPLEAQTERCDGTRLVRERLWLRPLPAGACLLVTDEAHLSDLEEHAAQAPQTARLASLGFMLAGVCHEISNPLAAIHSTVQLLQSDRKASKETLSKGIATIAINVRRVLDICKRLKDFSRVGERERSLIRIDWPIEEALLLVRQHHAFGGVVIEHVANPDALVMGDLTQLQQVFYNMLLNAVQAMRGRGRLHVITRREAGDWIEVEVRDTGPGIAPRHLPRLCEPFFTTKPGGEGTGLGLAISKAILQEHGGGLRAGSHPAGGAVFHVDLPLARRQQ